MKSTFVLLDEAKEFLCTFRAKHMTHEEGAVAGLQQAARDGQISVGIVEDCIKKQTYRKALKTWIKTAAPLVIQAATQLEIARVGTADAYLVCFDTTLSSEGKDKQVRCILGAKEGAYQIYVDTAFFDGGKTW